MIDCIIGLDWIANQEDYVKVWLYQKVLVSLRNPAPGTVSLSVLIIKSPFRITVKYSPALLPSLSPKTPLKTVSPLGEMTTRYETQVSLLQPSAFVSSYSYSSPDPPMMR